MASALINVMTAAALKAAKGLQRDFGEVEQLQVSRKGTANFVTKSDLRAEKTLIRELRTARPDFGFLTEESGEIPGKDPSHRWIIDPLDGTNNFIHATAYFCISIALEKSDSRGGKDIIAAVIYNPLLNEMFIAERGMGAFCNNRRMQVSQRKETDAWLVAANNPQVPADFTLMERVGATTASLRTFGSTALDLAHVAAGRFDGAWFNRFQPWDIAAGLLLVREAGGYVTDFAGKAAQLASPTLLAASPVSHPALLKEIAA